MGLDLYLEGNVMTASASVTDEDGNPDTPATAVFTVRDPSGGLDTFSWPGAQVENPEEGTLEASWTIDEPGRWGVHVATTDPTAAAEEWFRAVESLVVT